MVWEKKDFDNSEDFCKVYDAVNHIFEKDPFKTINMVLLKYKVRTQVQTQLPPEKKAQNSIISFGMLIFKQKYF